MKLPARVGVRFGAPLKEVTAQAARLAIQELSVDALAERVRRTRTTLARAFLEQAKRLWSKTAVTDSTGRTLTYGRALTATVLLGAGLSKALPAAPRVAVLLPPSVGGALANASLASIGRVPVNLNYTSSPEAVEHALKISEIEAVVTSRAFLEALKSRGFVPPDRPFVFVEDLLGGVPRWKQALVYALLRLLPRRAVAALFFGKASRSLDDEATVVFTSGSTALPKGVVLTHLNIQANVEMMFDAFPFTPADSMLGVLPFFHSFGYTASLWLPLTRGLSAAYHMNPLEPGAVAKLAARTKPTILLGTPTFLQRYVAKIEPAAFASLKHVISGAEKLRAAVADAFQGRFGVRPLAAYGSTELSPAATMTVPARDPKQLLKDESVGQILPGTAARVVDPETRKDLPFGEQGLLLIKGAHVMKGYLREPVKTAEVLRDGWYDTGDAAIIDRDGFVFIGGRLGSRFSKIGGEKVSHEVVEEKLQKAAGLTEQAFVVSSVPDDSKGERLVVLYTRYDGDISALLDKAREQGLEPLWTPKPSSFHKVESFPLLGTGKLDLKALKQLALTLETKP